MALLAAERSTCDRAKVGCVIVDVINHRVRSIGYNGVLSGLDHCDDTDHILIDGHCVATIHAEISCLSQVKGENQGLIAYVTHQPCLHCYKALVSFGVKKIYYYHFYQDKARDDVAKLYNVKMLRILLDE